MKTDFDALIVGAARQVPLRRFFWPEPAACRPGRKAAYSHGARCVVNVMVRQIYPSCRNWGLAQPSLELLAPNCVK